MTFDSFLFRRNKKRFQIIFSPILFWIYFLYEVLVGISRHELMFVGTGSLGSMFFDPVQVISDPDNILDKNMMISLSLTWRTDPQSCVWHSPRPCWPPRWARPCPQSGCREAPQSHPAQESTHENMIIISNVTWQASLPPQRKCCRDPITEYPGSCSDDDDDDDLFSEKTLRVRVVFFAAQSSRLTKAL